MREIKAAFQGEFRAYSEEAAFKFFGRETKTVPFETFKEVFQSGENKRVNFGIIPIENSLEGTIGQNYDLFLGAKVKIFGEEILKIFHCLITNDGVKINQIQKVFSHPQTLGQCREFLEKHKFKPIPFYDKVGACKMLAKEKLKDSACIGSERAAKFYRLEILKKVLKKFQKISPDFLSFQKNLKKKQKRIKPPLSFRSNMCLVLYFKF